MDIKEILKQLEKEKDPLKYLQKLKREIKDKKILIELEKLIEKFSRKEKEGKKSEAKIPSLEQIAQSISIPSRMAPTETIQLRDYQSRSRMRVAAAPAQVPATQQTTQRGYNDDYGANVKSDYIMTKGDFSSKLETSGLTTRTGFITTAESKEAIRRQAGDRKEYMEADNFSVNQYSEREEFIQHQERMEVMSFDQRQARKGKKEIQTYHGR